MFQENVFKTACWVICISPAQTELSHPDLPFRASPCFPLVFTLYNCCNYMQIAVNLHVLTRVCNGVEITAGNSTLSYEGQYVLQLEGGTRRCNAEYFPTCNDILLIFAVYTFICWRGTFLCARFESEGNIWMNERGFVTLQLFWKPVTVQHAA